MMDQSQMCTCKQQEQQVIVSGCSNQHMVSYSAVENNMQILSVSETLHDSIIYSLCCDHL